MRNEPNSPRSASCSHAALAILAASSVDGGSGCGAGMGGVQRILFGGSFFQVSLVILFRANRVSLPESPRNGRAEPCRWAPVRKMPMAGSQARKATTSGGFG